MLGKGGSSRRSFYLGSGLSYVHARKLSYPSVDYRGCPWYLMVGVMCFTALFILYTLSGNSVFGDRASEEKQEFNYGIVLDAGSSGTRAYLYFWPQHTGNKHDLLSLHPLLQDGEPMVKKVTPGLSDQEDTPETAFEYIRPLLQFASDNIPKHKHKETPLYILATAGMRLVEKQKQEAILQNVRRGIGLNFEFYFPEGHLEIISGKQEGIYQWLAINYVLGKFNHNPNKGGGEELVAVEQGNLDKLVFRPRTVGALDMGGASLQIAMEITTNLQLEGMSEKDKTQIAEVNIGCTEHDLEHTYRVFVTTFLGFGANQALARHNRQLFIESYLGDPKMGVEPKHRIKDPCRPSGMKDNITLELDLETLDMSSDLKSGLSENQVVFYYGTGDWEACYTRLKNFTKNKEAHVACKQV